MTDYDVMAVTIINALIIVMQKCESRLLFSIILFIGTGGLVVEGIDNNYYYKINLIIINYLLIAIIDLEPSGVLYVCHGGAMSVTCSTSADLLHWNVALLHPSPQRTFERILTYIGTIRMETPIMTNLTTLRITRSLDSSSSLPLVSTITTENVTTDLNGTMITCSGMLNMMIGPLATENVEVILIGIQKNRSRINNGKFVLTTS
jgi:hypothetical protein